MTRLLDDMFDVSRMEHGKLELHRHRIDVRALVATAVEDKKVEIAQRGLSLRIDLEEDGGAIWMHGDPTRLTQVFYNLIGNATKFTAPPGDIVVCCRDDEAGRAVLTFSDTGPGIERSLVPYIFEPFAQDAAYRAKACGGLGLGLALVQRLVAMHDGTVRVDSAGPGEGTRFTLILPKAE